MMSMRVMKSIQYLLVGCFSLLAIPSTYADERVISIRELIAVKKNWPLFAETHTSFVVRGVISSRTDEQIHMRNCKLHFIMDSPDSFPRLKPGSKMVKLTGHFDTENNVPVFKVTKAASEFSLEQVHLQMSVEIDTTNPAAWRKLAAYTAAESKFYENNDLFLVAANAFEHSYVVTRTLQGKATSEEIQAWVTSMKEFGVPKDSIELWEYERFMMEWQKLQSNPQPQNAPLLRLAKDISTKYPASLTPLEVPVPKLEESSQQNPIKTFRESDQGQQNRLWRLLYREVLKTEVLLSAKDDGSNADHIRDQLKEAIPDLPDLYLSYDLLWLDWRFSQLGQSGKEEAIKLSVEYRKRNQSERGNKALETWLMKRLQVWSQEGPAGYVRAAEHYIELLEDKEKAHELLLKAWKLSPGQEETAKALESLGFRLHSGSWLPVAEYRKLPPDPIQTAIRNGEVIKGMTAQQVERSIGKPELTEHSFSTGHISEAWIYGDDKRKRIVVHLLRSTNAEAQFAKVIAVGELKPRRLKRDLVNDRSTKSSPEE